MNENDYQAACKELFERIEERLEETDTDYNNNGGVLEIERRRAEKSLSTGKRRCVKCGWPPKAAGDTLLSKTENGLTPETAEIFLPT